MNNQRAKEVLQRLDDYADGMINEGKYLKKNIREIKKEMKEWLILLKVFGESFVMMFMPLLIFLEEIIKKEMIKWKKE